MRRPQPHDQGPTKEVDPAEDATRRCLPKTYLVGPPTTEQRTTKRGRGYQHTGGKWQSLRDWVVPRQQHVFFIPGA